jgi:Ca2+-binding EF-hand superfamily protein
MHGTDGVRKMKISNRISLAVAVSAALLAAGAADAGSGRKSKGAVAAPAASAPAAGSMSMAQGMGPGGGMQGGGMQGARPGPSFLLDQFDAIDADKNGQLSRAEVTAWVTARQDEMRQRIEDHVKAADTNGDGLISLDEAKARLPMVADHFDFLDANKDGQISKAEFERLRDPGAMRTEVLARLQAADKDKDGKLNLAEAQVAFPALAAHFSQLDKDNDGWLTLPEVAALMGPH